MSKIRIVTDSTADLPQSFINQYDISIVPLKVMFGTKVYRDKIDINTKQFYEKQNSGEMSMSSHPAPVDFLATYEDAAAKSESIISIHISSQLSDTIKSAQIAKDISGYHDIDIIDSLSASSGLGLIVIAAAKAAHEGKNKEEIIDKIRKIREQVKVFFMVDTLEYLIKGGRISRIEGFVGSLLNIKPIMTIKEGKILPFAKIMSKSKAIDKLIDIIKNDSINEENFYCSLIQGHDSDSLKILDNKFKQYFDCKQVIYSEFGPVIGTHVGPKVIGVAYYSM